MDATPRWALPMLFAGQAQKEMFHNEALVLIDALMQGQVESADAAVPPGAPGPGQCWVVAAGAGGAWAGQERNLACWSEGGWRFVTPRAGLRLWVSDRNCSIVHDGSEWRDAMVRADGLYVDNQQVVGAREAAIPAPAGGTVTDMEARNAIGAILNALRSHGLIAG